MKKHPLKSSNIQELKALVGKSKFVLFLENAYWTKSGTSPRLADAQKQKPSFFETELCKEMAEDEIVHIVILEDEKK